MRISVLISVFALISFQSFAQINNAPVIGILSYPSEFPDNYSPYNYSYFPASYAKWLEAAGARVVPIRYDLPAENVTWLLNQLNGALFPGGGVPILIPGTNTLNQLGQTMKVIVDFVFESNRNGRYFPMWGTCEGFQMMSLLVANDYNLMVSMPGCMNVTKPIYFFPQANTSKIFDWIPENLQSWVQEEKSCYFFHQYTIDPDAWTSNANLASNFTTVAYTFNPQNKSYVALISGKEYPFFGSQFHPEQIVFEWFGSIHYPDNILFSQTLGNFFVYQARQSPNTFPDVQQYLIYNYEPVPFAFQDFEQAYFFENVNFTRSACDEIIA